MQRRQLTKAILTCQEPNTGNEAQISRADQSNILTDASDEQPLSAMSYSSSSLAGLILETVLLGSTLLELISGPFVTIVVAWVVTHLGRSGSRLHQSAIYSLAHVRARASR